MEGIGFTGIVIIGLSTVITAVMTYGVWTVMRRNAGERETALGAAGKKAGERKDTAKAADAAPKRKSHGKSINDIMGYEMFRTVTVDMTRLENEAKGITGDAQEEKDADDVRTKDFSKSRRIESDLGTVDMQTADATEKEDQTEIVTNIEAHGEPNVEGMGEEIADDEELADDGNGDFYESGNEDDDDLGPETGTTEPATAPDGPLFGPGADDAPKAEESPAQAEGESAEEAAPVPTKDRIREQFERRSRETSLKDMATMNKLTEMLNDEPRSETAGKTDTLEYREIDTTVHTPSREKTNPEDGEPEEPMTEDMEPDIDI